MSKYGLNLEDKKTSQLKIDTQKKYLASQGFLTQNGEFKTFADISMSANISERYYAQLVNKVNTMQQSMSYLGLSPVFMTITLDGAYQRLLTGDYSKFTDKHLNKLPNNDRFGYLQDLANEKLPFTVKDLYKLLRYQWNHFQKDRLYLKIKSSHDIGYLFEVEPHESGVPHAHVLFYAPSSYFNDLKELFKSCFPARQNKRTNKITFFQKKNGEINGFQWTLKNPVGYILKYCTKSFMDIKNNKEIDYLQSWYITHKIVRLTTSRSLIPQWVYQKMYPLNDDWLYQSILKYRSSCEWSRENDYFIFEDEVNGKVFKYERGLYQVFINNKLVREFGSQKEKIDTSFRVEQKPIIRKKKNHCSVKIVIDGQYFDFYEKPISKKSDFELYTYYHNLDIETCNLHHFGLVQNQLSKRGLIDVPIQPINNFNLEMTISNYSKNADEISSQKNRIFPNPLGA
ncbi:MAG: hypothetical protein R3331_09250 [Sulfurospirillaceae bacterium]|nr:hypothetical protein [Sulfurospirillaceae bacterium]